MKARLSPNRGLFVALACGAAACSLGASGLMETVVDGAAPPVSVAGGSGSGSGGTSSGGSSAPDASVGGGSQPDEDAAAPDATTTTDDAGAALDDAALENDAREDAIALAPDGAVDCDRDDDGFLAIGACGGTDCCDYDSRAHPTETDFFATPDACGSFDYDCDGQTEAEYTIASCALAGFSCGTDGFDTTVPSCGDSGTFDTCTYEVVSCGSDPSVKVQACR